MDLLDFIGYAFTVVIVLILCAALEVYVDGGGVMNRMLNKFYGRLATINYWLFVAVYSIVNLFDFVGRLVLFPFVTMVFVLCAILDLLKESACELPQAFLWIIEPFKSIGFSINEKAYVLQWLENNKNKRGE